MTRARFAKVLDWCGLAAVLTAIVAAGCATASLTFWVTELLVHWQFWIVPAAIPALLWFLVRRERVAVGLSVLALALGASELWRFRYRAPDVPSCAPSDVNLRVGTANLFEDCGDVSAAVRSIMERHPDVISFQEVTPGTDVKISDALGEALPHRRFLPEPRSFGLGIASRWPIDSVRELEESDYGTRQLVVELAHPTGPLRLCVAHVLPPVQSGFVRAQRRSLADVSAYLTDHEMPTVLAGDLNLAPWSPTFRRFLEEAGLQDVRQGRGFWCSWVPPGYALLPPLLPIDHVLVGPGVAVGSVEVGPAFGSDHRWMVVGLAIHR